MSDDRGGPFQHIISNLDELEGINPQLARAIREQEEGQVNALNEALKGMPPEEIVNRLKGLLWRLVPVLRLSEMMQLDLGTENLSVSLRYALSGLTDAVKWISWKNDIDPFADFGDDTVVVALKDMVLGTNLDGHDAEIALDAKPGLAHHKNDDEI